MEFILDDQNIELQFQKILREIIALQDGVTSENMELRGVHYEKNWGVSIPGLRLIAQNYEPNHLLAFKLWNKKWRESMIIATMLDEPQLISEEQMDFWVRSMETTELVEQAVMNLFSKSKVAYPKALEWCRGKKFLVKYAGLMLMGRLAFVSSSDIDEMFEPFFDVLLPLAKDPSLYTVFYRSFCQLGRRSLQLNKLCIEFALTMKEADSENSQRLGNEIIDELESDFVKEMLHQKQ